MQSKRIWRMSTSLSPAEEGGHRVHMSRTCEGMYGNGTL